MFNIFKSKRFWIGLILIISIGANIFYFGREWLRRERQNSFNAGVIWVFDQGRRLGRVSYTTPEGEVITLVIPIQPEE